VCYSSLTSGVARITGLSPQQQPSIPAACPLAAVAAAQLRGRVSCHHCIANSQRDCCSLASRQRQIPARGGGNHNRFCSLRIPKPVQLRKLLSAIPRLTFLARFVSSQVLWIPSMPGHGTTKVHSDVHFRWARYQSFPQLCEVSGELRLLEIPRACRRLLRSCNASWPRGDARLRCCGVFALPYAHRPGCPERGWLRVGTARVQPPGQAGQAFACHEGTLPC